MDMVLGSWKRGARRRTAGALALAGAMTLTCVPVSAAELIDDGVTPTCDEAYYATLDYYGNLTEGGVVKSYALNGAKSIQDYGTYDQVVNLTDDTAPTTQDGVTTFDFGADAPEHFYFEGVTAQPFQDLPWTISMSYKLNGVATKAQDLAGKTGEVEISLNFVPNPNASDYAKNNYTLEAMAMFNQDDILSLEAEGAQVQLVGNLRVVLFLALPGEEQHFTIRVGSNDFAFDGMTYLLVPATLSQLSQIADLSQKKDDLEKNYNKLSGSLDTLLDSLNNMSGSLNETAEGLDELNQARGTISAGKGDVYAGADTVLGDLDSLNEAIGKLPAHLDTASTAVDDVDKSLKNVTSATQNLLDEMEDTQKYLNELRVDLTAIRDLTGTTTTSGEMQQDLEKLETDAAALKTNLTNLRSLLAQLQLGIGTGSGAQQVTVQGMTLAEVNAALDKAKMLENTYSAVAGSTAGAMNYNQYLVAAIAANIQTTAAAAGTAVSASDAVAQAQALISAATETAQNIAAAGGEDTFFNTVVAGQYEQAYLAAGLDAASAQAKAAQDAAAARTKYDTNMQSVQGLQAVYESLTGDTAHQTPLTEQQFFTAMLAASGDANPAADAANLLQLYDGSKTGLLANLSALCDTLGASGLTGDLKSLTAETGDALKSMDKLLDQSDDMISNADSVLTQVKNLNDTADKYVPDLKQTLSDTKDLLGTTQTTISDTRGFLTTFESLTKKAGSQLDSGTQKTLTGLAATLRKAASSLSTTKDVRSAKDNISDIIEDTWEEYTGKTNNLLNMDANAEAVSLTSSKNTAPQSVQILLRSEEIKTAETETSASEETTTDNGTFLSRVGNLFKKIWTTITGVFGN